MPNTYTETRKIGYGSKIMSAIKGIFIGILIFLGSFIFLFWNEGRTDFSKVAETSVSISAESEATGVEDGALVALTGILESNETIGDEYVKKGNYITLKRSVEMYAWVESSSTTTEKNYGGSETETTTYNYEKEWTSMPQKSSKFKLPEGHENDFTNWVEGKSVSVNTANIGIYNVAIPSLSVPGQKALSLTEDTTNEVRGVYLTDGEYLFMGGGSLAGPEVGAVRISYLEVSPGNKVTLFGALNKGSKSIDPHYNKDEQFYRMVSGTRDAGISQLASEHKTSTWIFRLIGFLLMWSGLAMVFKPLSVLLDVLPFLGDLTGFAISIITFVVALILSIITIIISMIFHSLIAVLLIVALGIGATAFYLKGKAKKVKKKKS